MSFHYRYRKQIKVISLITIFLVILGSFLFYNINSSLKDDNKSKKNEKVISIRKVSNKSTAVDNSKEISNYMVDIKGEIVNPGTYQVDSKKRIIDVINMAGGLTENGDTSVINLSKKVKDEMVIIIYSFYQVRNFKEVQKVEEQVYNECVNSSEVKNDGCISNDDNSSSSDQTVSENILININTASSEELQKLTGIGEAKAKDIITYRETNGNFLKIEDIKNVSGIGDALFAKIK